MVFYQVDVENRWKDLCGLSIFSLTSVPNFKENLMKDVEAFNLKIHTLTMADTLNYIDTNIRGERFPLQHIVVNAAKIVHAQKDLELRKAINNSHIVNIDGQAVVWALRMLGSEVPERVAGCDLFQDLIAHCEREGYKPYFLGAKQEVLDTMIDNFQKRHPKLQIAGARNGYFGKEDEEAIANEVKASGADMIFLGITSPKKELFIDAWTETMQVPFTMGVGGSFDIVAGKTERAPEWMRKAGLEWFFRIMQEPGRMWKRYAVTNTLFIIMLIKALVSGNKGNEKKA